MTEESPQAAATHRIRIRYSKFTTKEDGQLKTLVEQHGQNWVLISSLMQGRDARQCMDRWTYYLSPSLNKSQWTPEEDNRLMTLYAEVGPKWVAMSSLFIGRTDTMLKNRYKQLMRKSKKVMIDSLVNHDNKPRAAVQFVSDQQYYFPPILHADMTVQGQ